MKNKISEELS